MDENIVAPERTQAAQSVSAEETKTISHSTQGRSLFIGRILVGAIVFLGILLGAYLTASHFAKSGYFLDENNGRVVLMSGREGGVLWWDPSIDTQTGLDIEKLASADRILVTQHTRYESRHTALKQLDRMRARQRDEPLILNESTTTSGTTSPSTVITSPITISEGTSVGR